MSSSDRVLSNLIDKHIKGRSEFKKPNSTLVYCQPCSKTVKVRPSSVKFSIESHSNGKKHIKALEIWKRKQQQQQFINVGLTKEETFKQDLTKMLVRCNIPIHKVSNSHFQEFIANYCGKLTPDESTLRKKYLNPLYRELLSEMRAEIGSNSIYLQVDESTDSSERPVVSIIVGILNGSKPRSFLLDLVHLESSPDSTLICRAINDSLRVLWPEKLHYNRVRLLVSDQAAYMLKAGRILKSGLFTELLHITCLAHALHRVAEYSREKYPDVNNLVSAFKAAFVKCPRRKLILKESTQKAIPKFPVITRWGTWLTFVSYLFEYLDDIEVALAVLDEEDSEKVEKLKECIVRPSLRQDLQNLSSLFCIPKAITFLEKRGLTIDDVRERVESVYASLPVEYQLKLTKCIYKSPSYNEIFKMEGKDRELLRYAPLVSVDVERSFSHLKLIDTPQRSQLTQQHFKELALIKFNSVDHKHD